LIHISPIVATVIRQRLAAVVGPHTGHLSSFTNEFWMSAIWFWNIYTNRRIVRREVIPMVNAETVSRVSQALGAITKEPYGLHQVVHMAP